MSTNHNIPTQVNNSCRTSVPKKTAMKEDETRRLKDGQMYRETDDGGEIPKGQST